jgi:hypothetical protein
MKGAQPEGGCTSRAPLGAASRGRLVLAAGASQLAIRADPAIGDLYRARFGEPVPEVRVEEGTVTIRHPRRQPSGGPYRERPDEVVLNGRIPWRIESGRGVSRLAVDLSGLELTSFEIEGGASRVELRLPKPAGSVLVSFRGGASTVAIRRPEGVAARVRMSGGATCLNFDQQQFGVVGDEVELQTPDYDDAPDRYDVVVTGGANNLIVDDAPPDRSAHAGVDWAGVD